MEPLTALSQEGAGGGEPPGGGPLWTAVFEYEACGEDELSLRPGDVVQVLSRDSQVSGDEGWWTGQIDQRVGIFPSNYVSSGVQGGGPELRARYPPPPAIQRKERGGGGAAGTGAGGTGAAAVGSCEARRGEARPSARTALWGGPESGARGGSVLRRAGLPGGLSCREPGDLLSPCSVARAPCSRLSPFPFVLPYRPSVGCKPSNG